MSSPSVANMEAFYNAIDSAGPFIPKRKMVVAGVLSALTMQCNLVGIIGEVNGILSVLMKDLATQIEKLNNEKVIALQAINDAISRIGSGDHDKEPLNGNDLYQAWITAHPEWKDLNPKDLDLKALANDCEGKTLNVLMNFYSTKSTEWDNKIKPLQSLTDAIQSSISNGSQNQASFIQQLQALENLFTQLT